ncbi:MAG: hypothetical protein QM689_12630 [Oscillospiraceae bacterium]
MKRWRRIVDFGNGCGEVEEYYSTRRGNKKSARGKNRKSTDIDQLILNERYAEDKLRWLINTNFRQGDMHIALTYRKNERPEFEESIKRVNGFLRTLRSHYKKIAQPCKYIWSTELSKRGVIHHHFVIEYIDLKTLSGMWKWGKVWVNGLLDNTGEYGGLANYIIKQNRRAFDTPTFPVKKRWNASKNLKQPEIRYKRMKGKAWRNLPQDTKKYRIVSGTLKDGIHGLFGTPWRHYQIKFIE